MRKDIKQCDRYCKYCGKKLERKRFGNGRLEDFTVFKKRQYCDRICMRKGYLCNSPNQTYRSSHQTARTTAILFFPEITICSVCGKTGKMDIHHIDGDCHNNSVDNLTVLCRSCHMKLHAATRHNK